MKNQATCIVFFVVLYFFLLPWQLLGDQREIVLSTPGQPPYHYPDQSGIMDKWIREPFQRIGVHATLQWFPPERSLINTNIGLTDGDAVRVGGLTGLYPNLIQVPEKIYDGKFVAFTKKPFEISDWGSLKQYNVGFVNGHKICEENITEAKSITQVDNNELLFTLLQKNRVDVVITESLFGMEMIRKLGLSNVTIHEPPLARLEFFLYLNKKHELLLPRLVAAIRDMKADGTHSRIYQESLARLDFAKRE